MLRIYQSQRFLYASFFLLTLGFCANTLAAGECKADLSVPLKNEYNEHDFLAACREGNVEAVTFFVSQDGFDVNEQFISGASGSPIHSLYLPAQNGYAEVVQILVNAGAEVDQAWGGATPLFIAAQNSHAKVVQILLNAGANPLITWRWLLCFTKSPLSAAEENRPWSRKINPAEYDRYTTIIHALKQATRKFKVCKSVTIHHSTAETERTPLLSEHSRLRLQPVSKS
ncbi:ankyrin repeat domain-containing protein [Sansalvadorimonas verongulae]|uniref:ankyrin repeat domain-containing protein n=1 Tax=Sansalvadorimonas verongulae TaxID=2172824 RepID=UPI0012BB87B2|nr:ankyrin repeat domain-containing protein [Sansalvadorimonas verongulae]MTI13895.1 ankyrin repeat domain-containing protein [Sansalvadorimonas verongulae]